jgi:hypothetical protein
MSSGGETLAFIISPFHNESHLSNPLKMKLHSYIVDIAELTEQS